jgi:hypothetical protein
MRTLGSCVTQLPKGGEVIFRTRILFLTMAAAPADLDRATEVFFRPSTQLADLLSERPHIIAFYGISTEVELLPYLTPEDVLASGVTLKLFHRFVDHNKFLWMAPGVGISPRQLWPLNELLFAFAVDFNRSASYTATPLCFNVHVTPGATGAAVTATCDFLVRLFAASEKTSFHMQPAGYGNGMLIHLPASGAALSCLFHESRDNLQAVHLMGVIFNEEQIRVLATVSRPTLEVILKGCSMNNGNAACRNAFVVCLQSDRGPTQLLYRSIDLGVLATALTGNTRVTRLHVYPTRRRDADAGQDVLFRALANNLGLVELQLTVRPISDENMAFLCESLKSHPTLTTLHLQETVPRLAHEPFASEQKKHRTRMMAEMMQENTILHTIDLFGDKHDEQIYEEAILPYLVTNLHRPRVLTVAETSDRPFREKVLGRALFSVRSNPNLVWMFLSQNVDACVRSEEEEEENNGEETVAVEEVAAAVASEEEEEEEENPSEETEAVEDAATVAGSNWKH